MIINHTRRSDSLIERHIKDREQNGDQKFKYTIKNKTTGFSISGIGYININNSDPFYIIYHIVDIAKKHLFTVTSKLYTVEFVIAGENDE